MSRLPAGENEVHQHFDAFEDEWEQLAQALPLEDRRTIEDLLDRLYQRLCPEAVSSEAVAAEPDEALDARLFLRGEGAEEQQVWIEAPLQPHDRPFEVRDVLALSDENLLTHVDIYVMETIGAARMLRTRHFASAVEMRAFLEELRPRDGLSWRQVRDRFLVWHNAGPVGHYVHRWLFERLVPAHFASMLYLAEVGEIMQTLDTAMFLRLQMRGAGHSALSIDDWKEIEAGLEAALSKADQAFPAQLAAVLEYLCTELC